MNYQIWKSGCVIGGERGVVCDPISLTNTSYLYLYHPFSHYDGLIHELLHRTARSQADRTRRNRLAARAAHDDREEGGAPSSSDSTGSRDGKSQCRLQQERYALFFTPPSSAQKRAVVDMMIGAAHAIPFYIFFASFLGGFWGILVATAALRRKKMHEADLDKLAGMRLQLEVQVNTVESANINANTLDVMRRGANALRDIHNGLCVQPSHPSSSCYSNLISMLDFLFPVPVLVPVPSPPSPTSCSARIMGFAVPLIRSTQR
jgi:hypothetical protein